MPCPTGQSPWSERYPAILGLWEDEPAAPKGNTIRNNVFLGGRWNAVQKQAEKYVVLEDNYIEEELDEKWLPNFTATERPGAIEFELDPEFPATSRGFKALPPGGHGSRRQATVPRGQA